MLRKSYDAVMNVEENPLSNLPKTTGFQIMTVLSFMWSIIFTMSIGSFMLFGPTVIAHVLVLIGVFFTADIFRRANKKPMNHRDAMRSKKDGTALYDDVWGA